MYFSTLHVGLSIFCLYENDHIFIQQNRCRYYISALASGMEKRPQHSLPVPPGMTPSLGYEDMMYKTKLDKRVSYWDKLHLIRDYSNVHIPRCFSFLITLFL